VEKLREMASWGFSDQELLADVLRDAADLLEADTGRLDWLEKHYGALVCSVGPERPHKRKFFVGHGDLSKMDGHLAIRAAIDAARESEVSGQAGSERDEG